MRELDVLTRKQTSALFLNPVRRSGNKLHTDEEWKAGSGGTRRDEEGVIRRNGHVL
jgi:hypothetical protein